MATDLRKGCKRKRDDPNLYDLPECKYGRSCYRLNNEHFRSYRHPDGSLHMTAHKCHKLLQHAELSNDFKSDLTRTLDIKYECYIDNPFSLFLNIVEGIDDRFNLSCLSIKDILSNHFGHLKQSAQFNYCIDISWLMHQYPSYHKNKPLLIVHGFKHKEKTVLDEATSQYDNVQLCQAPLDIPFGTHHTKMMLHLYEEGMRVIVTTANLIESDWLKKTQSIWISPIFPKLKDKSFQGDSSTHFKKDLIKYLSVYKRQEINEWIEIIKQHDFSQVKVYLIASVPGRFNSTTKASFGHLKLRQILGDNYKNQSVDSPWPVVCQTSSIGSLGSTPDSWLTGEFLTSLCNGKGDNFKQAPKLMIVYPSVENIRDSLEGYISGTSFPYSYRTANKQSFLNCFLHQWKFDSMGRTQAMPHLKSYFRYSTDPQHLSWYLVTSANLSKAAWGCLEKGSSQLFIRSYEVGVLFLPQNYSSICPKDAFNSFPVSCDLPLTPYLSNDKPWVFDAPYLVKADFSGRIWKPC